MPVIGAVCVLIQFCFAYHVFRTGRPYWWIFIIMGFPVMGCIIYYLVEVFPGSREQRSAKKAAHKIVNALEPTAELRRRAAELEICGSVENRRSLAEECIRHRMFDEALKLYESCIDGPFANDAALLFGLARAAVEASAWQKADAAIGRLKAIDPKNRPLDVRLVEARVLEGRGEIDAAVAVYRELVPVFVGLEARVRYGHLLARRGQHEAAMQMFNEVIAHSKRFASSIEDEQEWVAVARGAVRS